MLKPLALLISALSILAVGLASEPADTPQFQSSFMRVELALDQPALTSTCGRFVGHPKARQEPLAHARANPTNLTRCGAPAGGSNIGSPMHQGCAARMDF